ncbi:hypothetical protein TNCV_191801 [Trichonephila clavipes]|nr:hypothetical protein TNCV_191801 [Trichonephila clavipes]
MQMRAKKEIMVGYARKTKQVQNLSSCREKESEIEPIKQDPTASDQKSEESYLDQAEEISEDDDVDYIRLN